jgi:hypothetical protein
MAAAGLVPLFEQAGKGPQIVPYQEQQIRQVQLGAAQQEQQANQLKLQETQRQLGEYNTIRNYVAQNGGDYEAAVAPGSPLLSQISPDTALSIQQSISKNKETAATTQKSLADAHKAQLDAEAAAQKAIADHTDHLAGVAKSLLDANAPPAAVLAAFDQDAKLTHPPDHPNGTPGQPDPMYAQISQAIQQDPTKAQPLLNQIMMSASPALKSKWAEEADKAATRQHTEALEPGEVAQQGATLTKTNLENETAQTALDTKKKLLALPIETWNNQVDSVAGDDKAAAMRAKSQVSFYLAQGKPEEATKVIDKLAEQKGATAEEIRKQKELLPGEIDKAKQIQAATLPGDLNKAAAEAAAREGVTGASLDREAKQFGATHEKAVNDANAQIEKIMDARTMINGSAEAQALGIPKVLTALVSGAGSGVRITQPELNAIGTARGIGGDVQGFLNSISGKGKLTATQQSQLTGLLDDVRARVEQKRQIASDTLDTINQAKDRGTIVNADRTARAKLADLESSKGAANGGAAQGGYIPGRKYAGKTYQGGDPNNAANWK